MKDEEIIKYRQRIGLLMCLRTEFINLETQELLTIYSEKKRRLLSLYYLLQANAQVKPKASCSLNDKNIEKLIPL